VELILRHTYITIQYAFGSKEILWELIRDYGADIPTEKGVPGLYVDIGTRISEVDGAYVGFSVRLRRRCLDHRLEIDKGLQQTIYYCFMSTAGTLCNFRVLFSMPTTIKESIYTPSWQLFSRPEQEHCRPRWSSCHFSTVALVLLICTSNLAAKFGSCMMVFKESIGPYLSLNPTRLLPYD